MATEILQELRSFEKQQEEKLQRIEAELQKKVEEARKNIDKSLKEEKARLQEIKEGDVARTKDNAMEESKEVVKGYSQKISELQKKASKRSGKAVDKIFSMILGENV